MLLLSTIVYNFGFYKIFFFATKSLRGEKSTSEVRGQMQTEASNNQVTLKLRILIKSAEVRAASQSSCVLLLSSFFLFVDLMIQNHEITDLKTGFLLWLLFSIISPSNLLL